MNTTELGSAPMSTTIATAMGPQGFTYEDLDDIPDDGCRREVIGGSLIVTPSPIGRHQLSSLSIAQALRLARTPDTVVLAAPFDWHLPDGGCVQPDVMVIRRQDYDPDARLASSATPLLVVEVLSPSNVSVDRTLKRELYASLGVPAYWMVDPREASILALRLTDGRYVTEADLSKGDFATDWPFPVRISLDDLLT
ncbi:MAG: Uma2 family endonuclease [Acidimicrobiales bacterium]